MACCRKLCPSKYIEKKPIKLFEQVSKIFCAENSLTQTFHIIYLNVVRLILPAGMNFEVGFLLVQYFVTILDDILHGLSTSSKWGCPREGDYTCTACIDLYVSDLTRF